MELLGKIAGVDLFIERSEVTVRHKTTEDLEAAVREKLAKLSAANHIEDAEFRMAGTPMESEPVPLPKSDPFEAAAKVFESMRGD